ncbi:OmpA family protein [Pedobacter frigoris]|uniref:Flagellar motor protein MotB n=1 Tax=Pedobacter frigoris TaxID=2571272 RepID=A0A4U1CM67_9SPHI|nr:OmpA family protein [Pedobacter frigoris]TKC08524.1 flagellar motor protein MotB [Pedobacter frigoris]
MKRSLLISISALLLFCIPAKSQYVLNEADAQYNLYNYVRAIDLYEQAYAKKNTLHAAERLAESYSHTRNYKEAESWYAIASGMIGSKPEHVLGYAKSLVNNSKYSEAKSQFKKYIDLKKDVAPAQQALWLQSCDSAQKWMQHPVSINIQNVREMNSTFSDWGAVLNNGLVTFTSDRGVRADSQKGGGRPFLKFDSGKTPDKNVYGWTGNSYLRLYEFQNAGNTDNLALFPFDAGTSYHVGAASFTSDGKEMFFTLTRIPKDLQYGKGGMATVKVEIYSSKKAEDGKWGKPVAFKYNSPNAYSVGDPFISKDGKTLYFVSDMPGGKGGTDIYSVHRGGEGEWLMANNMSSLNTGGNERSPSADEAGDFYFSSDGLAGMGGLDVFKSAAQGSGFGKPLNQGYPVNSPQDDFAFNMYTATAGYLSSNRSEGLGSDDIYSITRQIIQAIKLEGRVYNKKTGLPLSQALVTLKNNDGQTLKVSTDESGYYSFNIDREVSYNVLAEKTNFRSADTSFVTRVSLVKDFYLVPVELNKPIRLENIYYDFDKSNIRPDAAIELDKLVKIMQENPTMWIELGSHTDSRGNDQYNQWLSQSRANSAVQYIIDHGISKNRITAKGYGESQLLNRCGNGVKCSEADHQLNRRTEFKIVKY